MLGYLGCNFPVPYRDINIVQRFNALSIALDRAKSICEAVLSNSETISGLTSVTCKHKVEIADQSMRARNVHA